MAKQPLLSREEAINYLANDATYRELIASSSRAAAPHDLSTAQARRYVSALRRAAAEDRPIRSLAELRGHTHTEHHGERKRFFKRGHEGQIYKKSGTYPLSGGGFPGSFFVVTRGESRAVRALKDAIATPRERNGRAVGKINRAGEEQRTSHYQVSMSITSSAGDIGQLYGKGGYDPAYLLEKAGYTRHFRNGHPFYMRKRGAPGLEKYLLDTMAEIGYEGRWRHITLYEIYAWSQPNPDVQGYDWQQDRQDPRVAHVKVRMRKA